MNRFVPNPLGVNQLTPGYKKKVPIACRVREDLLQKIDQHEGTRTDVIEEALENFLESPVVPAPESQIDAAQLLNEIKRLNPKVKLSLKDLEKALEAL